MAKGIFTQGLVVLLKSAQKIDALRQHLFGYKIGKQVDGLGEPWLSGPAVIVEYRPEVNGLISVDTVSAPWPDHMGDAKTESMLFSAWAMGHFGPLTFPSGMRRAAEQCWSWQNGREAVDSHAAFVRLRLSYTFGADGDARVMPADCDPEHELLFLTKMASALLESESALCYFNPNGEVLLPKAALDAALKHHAAEDVLPINLWSNVRMFKLDEQWLLMDSVGNGQLDTLDHEAAFPKEAFSPNEVAGFIRNMTLYVLEKGDVIKDGDTAEGPGDVNWQAKRFEKGISDPPRQVLRWLPLGQKGIPEFLLREKSARGGT